MGIVISFGYYCSVNYAYIHGILHGAFLILLLPVFIILLFLSRCWQYSTLRVERQVGIPRASTPPHQVVGQCDDTGSQSTYLLQQLCLIIYTESTSCIILKRNEKAGKKIV